MERLALVNKIFFPILFEELALTLWLLIVGVRQKPLTDRASPGTA